MIQTATRTAIRTATVFAPSPGTTLVGRQKLADNASPLPQDRVFLGDTHFNDVLLTADGVDVDRFAPGFEKTFSDRLFSFEARFPFATTLSSDIVRGGVTNEDEVEFGNVALTLKALLYQYNGVSIAGGLGLSLPTADRRLPTT